MSKKTTDFEKSLKSQRVYFMASNAATILGTAGFAETLAYLLTKDFMSTAIFASITLGSVGAAHIFDKKYKNSYIQLEDENNTDELDDTESYQDLNFM